MNISNIFSWMMRVKWKISKRMFVTLFTKKWIAIRNMQRVLLFLINKNWRKSGGKGWNELVLMILKKKKKNVSVSCEKRNTCIFKKNICILEMGKKLNIETILSGSFLVFEIFKDIRVFETMFACFLTLMKKVWRCKFNFMEQYGNTWYRIRSRLWSRRISSTYRTYNVTWTNIFIRSTHSTHATR